MTVVTSGYLGWIATVLIYTVNSYTGSAPVSDSLSVPSGALLARIAIPLSVGCGFLYLQRSPEMYYLYFLFPVVFWAWSIGNLGPILGYFKSLFSKSSSTASKEASASRSLPLSAILAFLCMQAAVVGYFHRQVFALALFGVAAWTASGMTAKSTSRHSDALAIFPNAARYVSLHVLWWVSCALVGVFTLIPLDVGENVPLVMLGALFIISVGVAVIMYPPRGPYHRPTRVTQYILVALSTVAIVIVIASTYSLAQKQGLPAVNQALAWGVLAVSLVFVFFYPRAHSGVVEGLVCLYLGIAPGFVLLSVKYEVLFYAALALNLFAWMMVELQYFNNHSFSAVGSAKRSRSSEAVSGVNVHDARRAVIYIIMCYVAIFGTGNVASISSFEITSTYRFLTVFSPFIMSSLLLWKLAAPMMIVSCVYFGLTRLLRVPRPAVFLLVVGLAGILF